MRRLLVSRSKSLRAWLKSLHIFRGGNCKPLNEKKLARFVKLLSFSLSLSAAPRESSRVLPAGEAPQVHGVDQEVRDPKGQSYVHAKAVAFQAPSILILFYGRCL